MVFVLLCLFLNIISIRLATLLERANKHFFKVKFQNYLFFYLWVYLCLNTGPVLKTWLEQWYFLGFQSPLVYDSSLYILSYLNAILLNRF